MNVLIVGVGGQGNLLASRVLGNVGLSLGYDVKVSEVHGMSQRGGSVTTYVKMDRQVYSPLIDPGEADYILAFEQLEALRYASYLKKDGCYIINTQKILPSGLLSGNGQYPPDIILDLKNKFSQVYAFDALALANACGNAKSVNMAMLGAMLPFTDIPAAAFIDAMKEILPEKLVPVNIKAFETAAKQFA